MRYRLAWYYATNAPVDDMDAADVAYHVQYDQWLTYPPSECYRRCTAITKAGLRCWRSARYRGRCGFHKRAAVAA